jgi:hypothetical protein
MVPRHRFMVNREALSAQLLSDAPIPIIRMIRVQLINAVLQFHFLHRWGNGLIIQAAPIEAEQFRLGLQCQFRSWPIEQFHPFFTVQAIGHLFFSHPSWVLRRPISAYNPSLSFSHSASFAA